MRLPGKEVYKVIRILVQAHCDQTHGRYSTTDTLSAMHLD